MRNFPIDEQMCTKQIHTNITTVDIPVMKNRFLLIREYLHIKGSTYQRENFTGHDKNCISVMNLVELKILQQQYLHETVINVNECYIEDISMTKPFRRAGREEGESWGRGENFQFNPL